MLLALLTCFIVAGLATGIVWFNDYLGVQADQGTKPDILKAYSYGELDDFVYDMEAHYSEGGDKGKYGLDLDADGGFFKCDGYSCSHCHNARKLDGQKITAKELQEKCDDEDPLSPYRYWFWMKVRNMAGGNAAKEWETGDRVSNQVAEVQSISKVANTLTALGSFGRGDWRNGLSLLSSSLEAPRVQAGSWERWHTEYYYTSTYKLDHKVNAKEDDEFCAKVPMGNVGEGGIVADAGNSTSGNKQLQMYVADLLPFYKKITGDDGWFTYTGTVYLHTVAGVSNASHTNHKSDIYKEAEWEKCSQGLPSMQWELKQSYNQWLRFDKGYVNLEVYAVKSEGDEVTDEEMEFQGEHQLGKELRLKRIPKFTGVELSGIKKFKDSDGTTYKLKGIRVQDKKSKQTWEQAKTRQAFMANDAKIFGTKKKTNKYSKKSGSGDNKDTITGIKCIASYINELSVKLDGDKFKKTKLNEVKDPKPSDLRQTTLVETPSGKISEKELQDLLNDVICKVEAKDTRICLIYQAVKEPEVTLKTDVYDWDGEKYESVSNKKPEEVVIGKLSASGESGPFDLTSNMVKPKTGENSYGSAGSAIDAIEEVGMKEIDALKDIYAVEHECGGEKPNHYVGEISIEYTDSNGEEHTVEDGNAPTEKLDYADPSLGEPVWNGTEVEREKIKKAIDSLYKKVKAEDVDYTDTISIYVKFYQPITPVVKTYWYQMVHENQKIMYKVWDSSEDSEAGLEYAHISKDSSNEYEFDYPETLNIGRAEGGGFKIDGADAGPVKVSDEETKAYAVKVKDHFKETENEWDDHTPGSKELGCEASKGSGECQTGFKGVNVAVVYVAKQPTLTIRIWKGQCGGDDSLNPPKDPCPDHGKEKVTWTKIDEIIETIDTSDPEASDKTVTVKPDLACAGYGEDFWAFGFIKEFTGYKDEGGCIYQEATEVEGTGCPHATGNNPCLNHEIKAKWAVGCEEGVVLDLYYLKQVTIHATAKYVLEVFTGDAQTRDAINNPPSSTTTPFDEIEFTRRGKVEKELDTTKKAADVTVGLRNTAKKVQEQGLKVTENGTTFNQLFEEFNPLPNEDLSQYGVIKEFTGGSNLQLVKDGTLHTDNIQIHWDKKQTNIVTIRIYFVKLVPQRNPRLIVNYYYAKQKIEESQLASDPDPNTGGWLKGQSSYGWDLVGSSFDEANFETGKTTCTVGVNYGGPGTLVKDFTKKGPMVGGPQEGPYTATFSKTDPDRVVSVYFIEPWAKDEVAKYTKERKEFTWNDISGGEGSTADDPAYFENNSDWDLVAGIQIAELANGSVQGGDYNPAAELGGQGDIVLPNGLKSGDTYMPNKLKAAIETSAYLSAGTVIQHKYKVDVPLVKAWCNWKELHGHYDHTHKDNDPDNPDDDEDFCTFNKTTVASNTDPDGLPGEWPKSKGDVKKNYRSFSLRLEFVWYEVKEVYLWEPKEGRVYSYAYPNSTDGSLTQKDNDTRDFENKKTHFIVNGEEYDAYSYFIGLEPKMGWRDPNRSDPFGDYGQVVQGDATLEGPANLGPCGFPDCGNDSYDWFSQCNWNHFEWTCESTTDSTGSDGKKCPKPIPGDEKSHSGTSEESHDKVINAGAIEKDIEKAYKAMFEAKIAAMIGGTEQRSDAIYFFHPTWEDLSTENEKYKYLMQSCVGNDDYGYRAFVIGPFDWCSANSGSLSQFDGGGKTVGITRKTELFDWTVEDVRIPRPEISEDGTLPGGTFTTKNEQGAEIPQEKLNTADPPTTNSAGSMCYKTVGMDAGFKSNSPFWMWTKEVNKVTLHTPVAVTMVWVSTKEDAVQTNKLYNKDAPPITMGTPFYIRLDYNGTFSEYGDVDTTPYLWEYDAAEMVFDYPVYANGDYHEAGETWYQRNVSGTAFHPAYWTVEDLYTFTGRVDALNVIGVDGSAGIEPRNSIEYCEFEANTDLYNHRAENMLSNYVTGILTDLRITDVADYPYLQYVWRKGDEGSLYQYDKTGYSIDSGRNNFQGILNTFSQFGVDWKPQTFPIVDGDTVGYKTYGVFKPGYKIKFNLTTIATLNSLDDYVQIEPSFYWIPKGKSGQTPQPVKVYYDEAVNGSNKKLVEVGSAADQLNVHQLSIGDKEHDADVKDLITTAEYTGSELQTLYQAVADAWTYGNVTIPGTMHVCEGLKNQPILEHAYGSGQTWSIPGSRKKDADKCLQTWYGEYYLPNTIHVRTADSDEKFKEDLIAGIDYSEDYWKNDGYLIVRFKINTVKGGEDHLFYDATETSSGYCDMWKTENAVASKTDSRGQTFNWTEGDFVLYDLSSSMSDDYKMGGTH